jgi:hypothetical protein
MTEYTPTSSGIRHQSTLSHSSKEMQKSLRFTETVSGWTFPNQAIPLRLQSTGADWQNTFKTT